MPPKNSNSSGDVISSKRNASNIPSTSLKEFYGSTLKLIGDLRDENDERNLITPFVKLPSKKQYPDYYTIITSPISINDIQKSLSSGKYSEDSAEEFLADFKLLHANAVAYNDPDSWIAQDSRKIYDFVKEEVEQFLKQMDDSKPTKIPKIKIKKPRKPNSISTSEVKSKSISVDNLVQMCKELLDDVIGKEFPEIGVISGPFIEDIDKKEYPDYFKIVENPTSFNNVIKKLNNGMFSSFSSVSDALQLFHDEVSLIFSNALLYNDPSSLIHQDSIKLSEYFNEKYDELRNELESFELSSPSKLKLKLKTPKESPKVKISLKTKPQTQEPVLENQPKKRGRKKKIQKQSSPLKTEEDTLLGIEEDREQQEDGEKETRSNLEEELSEKKDDSLAQEILTDVNMMGKCAPKFSPEEAYIQEVTLSSSQSSITQVIQSAKNSSFPSANKHQVVMHDLFPSHNIGRVSSVYEYRFPATGYATHSYSLNVPPDSAPSTTLMIYLHKELLDIKKKGIMSGQSLATSASSEDFQYKLFLNGDELINTSDISEQEVNNLKFLCIKFEVKLCNVLNFISFECKVAPNVSKLIKKDIPHHEIEGIAGRHTRHQLQQFKMNWEVEKVNLIVTYNSM